MKIIIPPCWFEVLFSLVMAKIMNGFCTCLLADSWRWLFALCTIFWQRQKIENLLGNSQNGTYSKTKLALQVWYFSSLTSNLSLKYPIDSKKTKVCGKEEDFHFSINYNSITYIFYVTHGDLDSFRGN